jgi:hypothetical protein
MATLSKTVVAGPGKEDLLIGALFGGMRVEFTMAGVGKRNA